MIDIESWKKKSQEEILAAIRDKSALIVRQRKEANNKGFSSVAAAIALQALELDRKTLQGLLNPLVIIVDNRNNTNASN